MRSLWSGVSGLQAHQLAMDVEGNNIANVNTIGFKYSRANFADMLSQTMKIATAPQGDIGGKNDMQVGLGTQVTSTTKIFSQGSTKNTDKNTDMTIQGDGFFIVSPDGGSNYAYTRNGDFNLDKNGTLVDSNGFAAQGWVKELATGAGGCVDTTNSGYVDSTQPIESLRIEPGLKIPANTTSKVELKANLNSGRTVTSMSCVCETAGSDGIDYKNASDTLGTALDFAKLYSNQATNFALSSATGLSATDIQNGTGFSMAINREGNTLDTSTALPKGTTELEIKSDGVSDIMLKAGDTISVDGVDYEIAADVTLQSPKVTAVTAGTAGSASITVDTSGTLVAGDKITIGDNTYTVSAGYVAGATTIPVDEAIAAGDVAVDDRVGGVSIANPKLTAVAPSATPGAATITLDNVGTLAAGDKIVVNDNTYTVASIAGLVVTVEEAIGASDVAVGDAVGGNVGTTVFIKDGLETEIKQNATPKILTYIDAFFVYTTGENGNPTISYNEDSGVVTPSISELNGGSSDNVYFFKAPEDLKKSLESFLRNENYDINQDGLFNDVDNLYGSKGVTVEIDDDNGTFVINNSPIDFNTAGSLSADVSKGANSVTLQAGEVAAAGLEVGDWIKIGNDSYEVSAISTDTLTLATAIKAESLANTSVEFAKATTPITTSRLYGFGGGTQQLEEDSVYTLKNQVALGDTEVQLDGDSEDSNILVGDIITIGGEYVKVTSAPDANNTIKFEPGLSRAMDAATKVIKYGAPDSMGDKVFTSIFNPLSGLVDANAVRTSNSILTKAFECDEDMGILFNANGEAFNLQSATQSDDPNKIDGEGVRITFTGTAEDGKTEISRTVTFRYTDGVNDGIASHPRVTGTVDGGIAHADSYSYIEDKDGNVLHDRPVYFKTMEDLRRQMQEIMQDMDSDGVLDNPDVDVKINDGGKLEIYNGGTGDAKNISIGVNAIEDDNTDRNVLFTDLMGALEGELAAEKTKMTSTVNAATHASSIEVYDSLGSKHSVRLEFRKTGAKEWTWRVEVPKPGTLSGASPEGNILRGGTVTFAEDGALKSVNPPTITFSANNGSKGDQIIQLDMGSVGGFDGITSLDKESTTSGISQDGYPSGDLLGIRIDQTGTVMGSFSNGRSLALAQVALAVFTNNSGLSSSGSNLFVQTSNSGEATIGTAGTGGRGSIMSSALEMSNVDLSKSLTELIVVQRGYQANSKTITTSDQMLEALLAIKR
jgi:flagellar hook protein FlgE